MNLRSSMQDFEARAIPGKDVPFSTHGSSCRPTVFTQRPHHWKPGILIIEDNSPVRAMMYESVTSHGYTAAACANREEAITVLGQCSGQIHLILADLSVLGKDGFQELLCAVGRNRPVKILLISGNLFCRDMQHLRKALAYPFLQKPFMSSELLAKIKELFPEV